MALPALAELEGEAETTFAGRGSGLFFLRPWAAEVCDLETPGWHPLFGPGPCRQGPPVEAPDLVLAFFLNRQPALEKNLKTFFPGVAVHLFPSLPPPALNHHVARHMAACFAEAGLPVDPARALERSLRHPLIRVTPAGQRRRKLVFHPGSGGLDKNLGPAFWTDLVGGIRRLPCFLGRPATCLLGPAEVERGSPFLETPSPDIETVICPPPDALGALLGTARLYLGHDSGVTHLAAMSGAPTVAFFRRDNTAAWRPLGPSVQVICRPEADGGLVQTGVAAAAELIPHD